MDDLKQLIQQFMPFAQEQMGFNRPPKLFLRQDVENAANPLGKTGFYDPQGESITLYISGRHPKDILRSLAHELMHHTQKCNGDFDNTESQGMGEEGYAQNNTHMRNMEIQAYQASIVFRDWEDSLKETIYYEHLQKGDKTMSTKDWKNGELTTLLSEAWGFGFKVDRLTEAGDPTGIESADEEGEEKAEKSLEGEDEGEEGMEGLEEERLNEMTGLEPLIAGLVAGGLNAPLAASIGQLAVGGGFGAALLGILSKHDPGLSPEAQAIATGEEDEELEEGGLADRPENAHRTKPHRGRRMNEDRAQVQEIVNRIVKQLKEKQKNG